MLRRIDIFVMYGRFCSSSEFPRRDERSSVSRFASISNLSSACSKSATCESEPDLLLPLPWYVGRMIVVEEDALIAEGAYASWGDSD